MPGLRASTIKGTALLLSLNQMDVGKDTECTSGTVQSTRSAGDQTGELALHTRKSRKKNPTLLQACIEELITQAMHQHPDMTDVAKPDHGVSWLPNAARTRVPAVSRTHDNV